MPPSHALFDPLDELTTAQREQLAAFEEQLLHFNRRFNLISSDTEAAFMERHVRHSLALTWKPFPPGSILVDWGTGGGLPAIPLAIRFPDVTVHAVDAVGKKIQAVKVIGRRLGLTNLHPWHGRAEAWTGEAHYSVSRATAPLADLWRWHTRVAVPFTAPAEAWMPGLICLKGGDLTDEIAALEQLDSAVHVDTYPLEPLLEHAYFAEKAIMTVWPQDETATGRTNRRL